MEDPGRKSLAGGDRIAHGRKIKLRPTLTWVGEQGCVVRRHGKEERGLMLFNDGEDVRRRGRTRPQNAGGTYGESKIKPVAQAVSKEHLGHAEKAVIFGD